MTLDDHNACLACPIHVRNLYASAQVLIAVLADVDIEGTPIFDVPYLVEPLETLRIAVQQLTPFVEAHLENQDHALSRELAAARHPASPQALVLSRVLPFPEGDRG